MADDEPSPFAAARAEVDLMLPEEGYVLCRIRFDRPPGEAAEKVATNDSLEKLSLPPETDWETYIIYDSEGNSYSDWDTG